MEQHFIPFRKNTIGIDAEFTTPFGKQTVMYMDWIASGRLYRPIEEKMTNLFGPLVGNTHSESNATGDTMTNAYHWAHKVIKDSVNAGPHDVIITAGSGMTTVINKLQRILGLTAPEQLKSFVKFSKEMTPVVFLTHMEHHSNQTTWLESFCDVEIIEPDEEGLPSLVSLIRLLEKYKDRKLKLGSFSACSNVTGIKTPYHQMAKIMHQHGGYCFVDFAASAPYVNINMHPEDPLEKLDAVMFSPHKFLGGPGTPGVVIFDSKLYERKVPDQPGGGTVDWTNPWGHHKFISNIEMREDGGTPPFLQTIKAALSFNLKDQMGVDKIECREKEILSIIFPELKKISNLHILADNMEDRLSVVSFYIDNIHYNLVVKLLNDRFGIQVRGGCSCAGTYGHYLLHVTRNQSDRITSKINQGDFSEKPGWVRVSFHPITTNEEAYYFVDAVKQIAANACKWEKDYAYISGKNEFKYIGANPVENRPISDWFDI
jgi:selenocysteine lyase/cysteine desulfurase